MIDAEGSRLLADVFNALTEGQENITPEDVAERIERFMTANGFRMVFSRWYLQCEPEVKQEPVAIVDANDEGYWADILPDRSVKVGQPLFAYPPDAQAEIAKRDKRIKELEGKCKASFDKRGELTRKIAGFSELTDLMQSSLEGDTLRISELLEQNEKQATEIARLKAVIAKCKTLLDSFVNGTPLDSYGNHNDDDLQTIAGRLQIGSYGVKELLNHSIKCKEAIAAIKEAANDTTD